MSSTPVPCARGQASSDSARAEPVNLVRLGKWHDGSRSRRDAAGSSSVQRVGVNSAPRVSSLTSRAPVFFPRYSGVRPTHQPADEHGEQHEHQHRVQAGADAAEDDLAHRQVREGNGAAQAGHDSNAALTAPLEVAVVTAVHSAEPAIPKRCYLPSMLGPAMPAACRAGDPCCSAA
jgi:hypothetical protein